jgi:curli biogenesis system outer membrane secretion channel CsgG
VKSTVQDISGDAVQLMLINALMKTDRFSIRPPDKSGGFPGVEYVFEPTLTQAKANKKVMGFLKDVLTSESPLNLDVRIFETKSNSLVGVITAKSTDIKSDGMDTAGALLGALTASKSESASASPSSEADKLEERLGPLMTHAADLLATRYGAAAGAQGGAQPSGTPWRR